MATRYVATAGDDTKGGTTPATAWATLAKVAASSSANDTILLNRGDIWHETLVAKASQSIGSYGSGALPIIRGTSPVSTWTEVALAGSVTAAKPAASGDDGHYGNTGSTFNATQNDNTIGDQAGVDFTLFLRIALAIPQGATIESASLVVQSASTENTAGVTSVIRAYAADNAAAPTTAADGQGRALTTASVNWAIPTSWTANSDYTSPDIAAVLQEVVNRAGWVSGNTIVLAIVTTAAADWVQKKIKTRDVSATTCARLSAVYAATGHSNKWSATLAGSAPALMVWDGDIFLSDKKTALAQIVNDGDWWHDAANNLLYVFKTATPTAIEASQRNGIEVYGTNDVTVDALLIERCQNVGIDNYGSTGLGVSPSVVVRDCAYHGVQMNHNASGTVEATISNPGLRMGDGAGVEVMDGSSATIRGEIFCDRAFSDGNQDGVMCEIGGSGTLPVSVIVEYLLVHNMDNSGVSIYNNSAGTVVVRYCTMTGNTWHGFQVNATAAAGGIIGHHNTISSNGPVQPGYGIEVQGASGGTSAPAFYHNTLHGNAIGLHVDATSSAIARNNISTASRTAEATLVVGGTLTEDHNDWMGTVVGFTRAATSQNLDPRLRPGYQPTALSPLRGKGVRVASTGQRPGPIDIGRYPYSDPRRWRR